MSMVSDAREHLYRELDAANLTVHVLDPRGLQSDAVDGGISRDDRDGSSRGGHGPPGFTESATGAHRRPNRDGQQST
jgi:hypothetical protein